VSVKCYNHPGWQTKRTIREREIKKCRNFKLYVMPLQIKNTHIHKKKELNAWMFWGGNRYCMRVVY
jgi:hypothetical protein